MIEFFGFLCFMLLLWMGKELLKEWKAKYDASDYIKRKKTDQEIRDMERKLYKKQLRKELDHEE